MGDIEIQSRAVESGRGGFNDDEKLLLRNTQPLRAPRSASPEDRRECTCRQDQAEKMRTPKGRWAHGLGRREADGSDAGLTRSRARGPVQGTDRGWGQRGPNHTHSHPNMAVTYPNDVRQDKGGRRGQVGAEQAGALARATPRGPRRRAPSPGLARGPAAAPPASEAPGSPLRGEASAPPPGSPANLPRFFSLLSYSSTGGLARERPTGSGPEAVLSEHAVGTGQPRRRRALRPRQP